MSGSIRSENTLISLGLGDSARPRTRRRAQRAAPWLALVGLALALLTVFATRAGAEQPTPALTDDQRRAYLEHYSPIIFKKANEAGWVGSGGRDWMTNFDFDNDQRFSNNKEHWEELGAYQAGSRPDWDIRPTVYSALLEYQTAEGKEATLIYHPYHAKQKGSIHDWERIEVKLSNLDGRPGGVELVDYMVITQHSKHSVRTGGDSDLNFMTTGQGKHVMIWRADQSSGFDVLKPNRPFKGELHFVEDSWTKVKRLAAQSSKKARVDINGHGRKGFHYVLVPQFDSEAVTFWKSRTLFGDNSGELASRRGTSSTKIRNVKRVSYELQDLADIASTHWDGGRYQRHWQAKKQRDILIEDPLVGGIDGGPDVPIGVQTFNSLALDTEDSKEDRKGFINKHWFWGTYLFGCGGGGKIQDGLSDIVAAGSFTGEALHEGAPNGTRMVANQDPESKGRYFNQHDYFVHVGEKATCDPSDENGFWLGKGWHRAENGGFDGRWVQLFPNGR